MSNTKLLKLVDLKDQDKVMDRANTRRKACYGTEFVWAIHASENAKFKDLKKDDVDKLHRRLDQMLQTRWTRLEEATEAGDTTTLWRILSNVFARAILQHIDPEPDHRIGKEQLSRGKVHIAKADDVKVKEDNSNYSLLFYQATSDKIL